MDTAKKAVYDKILAKLNIEHLQDFVDSVSHWAVTTIRNEAKSKNLKNCRSAKCLQLLR